ncbi:transcriptional regulator, TetR family [Seinonella peptonophila]|uniref:Transcriptional regulator, TetR family n=1 Tax=Seinonella peptonophila TaxID=112248 RepID=A0A1M5A7X2_9BACL|nr:TetR/AcrR family transcriptional regulator [Seinonella peptonophila]SHF26257.1 transcriptional regulator, TetR family [Seinonella peptonophila]
MPKVGKRDSEELRALILRTARTLFHEYGANNVSMHQIAKAAGVGQATLYRRYTNLGEIGIDLMEENISKLKERISELTQEQTLPIERILEKMVLLFVEFTEEKRQLICTIQTQMNMKKPDSLYKTPLYQILHEAVSMLIKKAYTVQERERIKPELTAHFLLTMLNPTLLQFLQIEKGYNRKEIVEQIKTLFFQALSLQKETI